MPVKISEFAAASALGGTEQFAAVQSGANVAPTADQLRTFCSPQVYIGPPFPYPRICDAVMAGGGNPALATLSTLNAAGLKCAFMGHLFIPGIATGATKTISSAGGKIHFKTGVTAFTGAGTTLDVGIQGVSTAAGPVARPDDTFTVSKTLTGGTDTITTNAENTAVMDTGTATLANGALIAVVFDMTAEDGTAVDSVIIQHQVGVGKYYPIAQIFSAAAWAAATTISVPIIRIEFDDGTLGYLEQAWSITAAGAEAWSSTTDPDERGVIMQVPFDCTASGIWIVGGGADLNSGFTYNMFSDPTGTPAALSGASGTWNARHFPMVSVDRAIFLPFSGDVDITKNTDYWLGVRATGSTNIRLSSWTVSAAANKTWFGNGTAGQSTRDGGTGAFSAKSDMVGYFMGLMVRKIIG